ncbi:MAG: carboxylating nicotinate-nucleotide diphosphorylase [Actinobacteria bacterium]|nr:carboxylating nicotinate-nucleotide diphosphorylase [Actinomycetota bacterium]
MGAVDPPVTAVREAVARALAEDLTPLGDISAALLPPGITAEGRLAARQPGVLAGTACATEAFRQIDPAVEVVWSCTDGDGVAAGQVVGTVRGPLGAILTAERTALNFLCHLSGVASLTRRFVDALAAAGSELRVWDTRKTTPGLRALEKAAVRAGGGANHRGNLSEWVMLKDNHLTVVDLGEAVAAARRWHPAKAVHVECDSHAKVLDALSAGCDAILLDNMGPDEARRCVAAAEAHADATGGRRPLIELSGGITLETVAGYADVGADLVSSGSLTISAPVLDLGLDLD